MANETCFLFLKFTAPPYGTNNSYNLGPVTACTNQTCDSSASTQQITVNVIPDDYVYISNNAGVGPTGVMYMNMTTNSSPTAVSDSGNFLSGCGAKQNAMNPEGTLLYVACNSNSSVVKINTSTNATTTKVSLATGAWGISVTPDGQRYLVSDGTNGRVQVRRTSNDALVANVSVSTITASPRNMVIIQNQNALNATGGIEAFIGNNASSSAFFAIDPINDNYSASAGQSFAPDEYPTLSPDFSYFIISNGGAPAAYNVLNIASNTLLLESNGSVCTSLKSFPMNPLGFSVDPFIYALCRGNNYIDLLDPSTYQSAGIRAEITMTLPYYGAFSPPSGNKPFLYVITDSTPSTIAVVDPVYKYVTTTVTMSSANISPYYIAFIP